MMKKSYFTPEMDLIHTPCEDVIKTGNANVVNGYGDGDRISVDELF